MGVLYTIWCDECREVELSGHGLCEECQWKAEPRSVALLAERDRLRALVEEYIEAETRWSQVRGPATNPEPFRSRLRKAYAALCAAVGRDKDTGRPAGKETP